LIALVVVNDEEEELFGDRRTACSSLIIYPFRSFHRWFAYLRKVRLRDVVNIEVQRRTAFAADGRLPRR
jgi:hypothetical protein